MTPQPDGGAAAPPPGCPAHAGATGTAAGGRAGGQADGSGAEQGAAARAGAQPLYGPRFAADPGAVYRRLRRAGPVAPVELAPAVDAWLVIGYSAALDVLRTPESFSKDARRWRALRAGEVPADSPVLPVMAWHPHAGFADGEEHRRLREAITSSLGRIDPSALRGYVEHRTDGLIDTFAPVGEADLLAQYASAVPLLVLSDMLGFPPTYGERLLTMVSGSVDGVDVVAHHGELTGLMREFVAYKRREPGADVTSWMMAHPAELRDQEMVDALTMLLRATQPQQNLIASVLRLLLSDDRFAGDLSGGSLPVDDALDEVLWTDPPLANDGVHYPVRDLDFYGVRLGEGDPVVISFAAANTDPLLPADSRQRNRAHLAWSAGPHTCPAQSPARLIASVAVEKLLDRIPDVELAVPVDTLQWHPGPFYRGLLTLPVRFPAVSSRRPRTEAGADGALTSPRTARHATGLGPGLTDSASGPWSANRPPSPSVTPGGGPALVAPGSANRPQRGLWGSLSAWWRGP